MRDVVDTIAAPATAPGNAAVHIVRISGPGATRAAMAFLGEAQLPSHGRCALRTLYSPQDGQALDQALVLFFAGPNSLTGEDIVELQLHGSAVLLQEVLLLLPSQDVRLAQPGEFTLRAFLNGKQDLTQAEAVNDLIHARSPQALKLAAQQLGGSLTRAMTGLCESLLELATRLEAELDFPDDVDALPEAELMDALDQRISALSDAADSFDQGQLWKDGFRIVLAGPPNVGKSSLFNALLGRERAIVTREAGTTRDYLEERLPDSPHPVVLVDTAGLRDTDSLAERVGIERSRAQLTGASLVLSLVDLTHPTPPETVPDGQPVWTIGTKADLTPESPPTFDRVLSAFNEVEVRALKDALIELAGSHFGQEPPSGALTNLRQHDAVHRAREMLLELRQDLSTLPRDIVASQVRGALAALDEVTGHKALSEKILDRIFSQFCIGK